MASKKRQAPKARRAMAAHNRLLKTVGLAFATVIVAAGIAFAWFLFESHRVIVNKEPIDLLVPYGTSARGVAALIRDRGADIHEGMFLAHARWLGVHKNLRAGIYRLELGLTKRQLIERLAGRDASQTEVRILEGWTVRQALDAIAKNSDIRFDLGSHRSLMDLAKAIDAPSPNPEGWIYPELYVVAKGSTASALLTLAVKLQQQQVADAWEKRREGLPYKSAYEALVVASIVEKETQYPGDRERVAAVFSNRLRLGMPLQADPTVIYGLGASFNGDLTRAHLRKDTPYNTYTRKTLPPTPIANPGPRAIEAVMKPAESKAIFFVARGDGSSEFSETLDAHNLAVNRFIRKLAGKTDK